MAKNLNFAQILDEKLKANSQESQSTQAFRHTEQTSDYAHLSYLLGSLGSFQFKTKTPQYKTTQKTKRTQGHKHNLTETQREAFDFFIRFGQCLAEDFTRIELKKAFRQLALRLHPDRQNGHTESFLELKRAHQQLELALSK